jgi:phage tail-like protein
MDAISYYPPVGFYFEVNFGDVGKKETDTHFQSVSGLSVEMQTDTVREGGENRFVHVIPKNTSYQNLTLKRGVIPDSGIIKWILDTFQSLQIRPVDLTITLFNEKKDPLMLWNVFQAWPKKWAVEDLNAMESKVLIESLEMQYQYFTIGKQ